MRSNRMTVRPRMRPFAAAAGILIMTASLSATESPPQSLSLAELVRLEHIDGIAAGGISIGAAPGARPVSLAAADLDEDGIADLVVGSETGTGGIMTVYPGNRQAVYPHSNPPVPTDASFHAASRSLTTSSPPELMTAGDFDGDRHDDLIAAAIGSASLEFFRGVGDGRFGEAEMINLGGRLTALATGEIHRRDGVVDLVAAVVGEDGPVLVILSDPKGALHGTAERINLPAPADRLVLGSFDDLPAHDLAVVAGQRLWILAGSEGRGETSLRAVPQAGRVVALADAGGRFAVLSQSGELALIHHSRPASKTAGGSGWRKTSIARIGDGDFQTDWGGVRLFSCRLSTAPTPDLLVHDLATGRLHLFMTSTPIEPPDHIEIPAAPVAQTTADLSARKAVLWVNRDRMDFGRPSGTFPIELGVVAAAALPMRLSPDALDDLVVLSIEGASPTVLRSGPRALFTVDSTGDEVDNAIGDGVCATASGSCTLRAAIAESNFAADLDSIAFAIPDQSDPGCDAVSGICTIQIGADGLPTIIQPVVIDATTQPGFAGAPLIELDGSLTGANVTGFAVWGGSTTIRGFAVNRFPNNSDVLAWNQGNVIIEGNFLGTDPGGTANVGSLNSLHISGITGATIGGTAAEARNLISGNTGPALALNTGAFDNFVEGNTFGLDVTGTVGLGNLGNDLLVMNASTGNTIGGAAAGAGNTIAANQAADFPSLGVAFDSSTNLIQGNRIGTNLTGADLGNLGISLTIVDASDNTIGGVAVGAGNVIAYNGSGVDLRGDTSIGNSIVGNSIHSNDFLGIDLCDTEDAATGSCLDPADVTPNDPSDPDTGANNLQNYPELASVDRVAATVDGTLDSVPSSAFTIDLYVNTSCDPTGHGEGETHVVSTEVATDAGGIATFELSLPVSPTAGEFLTATSTDDGGSTSEFSACFEIPPAADLGLTMRDLADPVAPGDTLVYVLDLTNHGTDDASGVVVTDDLPADSVFASGSASCVHAAGTVTCTVGDLVALGTVSLSIEVTVGDPPGGALVNTATATATEQDQDPANNSATETTRVDASLVFADGFETGTTALWSETVP